MLNKLNKFVFCSVLMIGGISGCAQQQVAAIRDSMDSATTSIRAEHKKWTNEKVVSGQLSAFDGQARMLAHKKYEDLVAQSRNGDSATTQPTSGAK